MKKSTLENIRTLANANTTLFGDELVQEINAEWERTTEKSRDNKELYDAAHDVLMACEAWDKPMTSKELWEVVREDMPEGFTESKMRYGCLNYWTDEVKKNDNGKNPATYERKPQE